MLLLWSLTNKIKIHLLRDLHKRIMVTHLALGGDNQCNPGEDNQLDLEKGNRIYLREDNRFDPEEGI